MSTFAASRVETKITITGENNAQKAVAEARDGLENASEAAGNVEKGLLGVRDILGSLPGPVGAMADAFGGAEKILQVLPGHLGLIATGVTAAAAAGFVLYQRMVQTEAKVKELGDTATVALADRLKLSVDAAIKLQQAFEDLPAGLRPAEVLIGIVRDRAERMGLDGAEAVGKFTDAIAKGPEGLRAFEREFGRLAKASADLGAIADRLGLSREALGIAEKIGDEGHRAAEAAKQAATQDRIRLAYLESAAELDREAGDAGIARSARLQAQSAELRKQATAAEGLVRTAVEEANALQGVVEKQREATRAATERQQAAALAGAQIAVLEAQATVALNKQEGTRLRLAVFAQRQVELERQVAQIEVDARKGLLTEVQQRQEIARLNGEKLALAGAEIALGRQVKADLDARRQKAQQAHDAEREALIRLAKVQADTAGQSIVTLGDVHGLRLRQLELEERAEVDKARRSVNTARGREAEIQAIHVDFAARRQGVDQAEADAAKTGADELKATLEAQAARTTELAAKTAEAVAQGATQRASTLAARLRALGDDERADLVERRQAWADYNASVETVNRELLAQIERTAEGSEDRRNLERQQLEAQAVAYEGFARRLDEIDAARRQRQIAAIREQGEAIAAPLAPAAAAAGLQDQARALVGIVTQAREAAAAFEELGEAQETGDLKKIAAAQKEFGKAADGTITAVGAVAQAFVSGEREKAAIATVTEAAASVAAFASGNIPGGVGHAAAAVLYGSVALGGGSTAPAGAGAGAGPGAAPGFGAGGGGQQGGGQVVNIFIGGRGIIHGTPQQLANGINGALGSIKGTGMKAGGV